MLLKNSNTEDKTIWAGLNHPELPLEEADMPEEPAEPTRRIDFDHLQFGRDYEIK